MKNLIIYTLFIALGAVVCSAQPAGKISMEKYLNAATLASNNGNHFETVDICTQAYNDTKDTQFLPALVQASYAIRDYKAAAKWAKMYIKEHQGKKDIGLRKYYASALKAMGDYKGAIKQYEKLQRIQNLDETSLELIKQEREGAELAMKSMLPKGIAIDPLGAKINKASSEYSPFVTSDGTLYYAALTNEDLVDASEHAAYTSKIFTSKSDGNGFGTPKALGKNINDPGFFHSNVTLSEDGKMMLFARQKVTGEGSIVSSQLYSSKWSNNKWSKPKAMHGKRKDVLYKSPAFGKYDGKDVVFFVSKNLKKDDNYDIYYATLKSNGKIGSPQRLDASINTARDEESPFYRNGYLYFSSKGHAGFGGYDVFKADLTGGTMENMGQPYNSPADDLYFTMSDDYNGILVSNRTHAAKVSLQSPTCCNDIYTVSKLRLLLEPQVVDAESGATLTGSNLVVMDAMGNKVAPLESMPVRYAIDPDKTYTVEVNMDGYEASNTFTINTADMWTSEVIKKKIELKPIKVVVPDPEPEVITVAEPIVLEEILFDYNDDRILTKAESDLRYLLKIMNEYPDIKIRISSHTDAQGSVDYNQQLSQRRSASVRNWLIQKGVDRGRIEAVGLGSARPIKVYEGIARRYDFLALGDILDASFISKLNKDQKVIANQLNRRSEFEIIEGPRVIVRKK